MLKRVVTGAVIFVLMCVGIVFQGWVLRLMLLAAALTSMNEMYRAMKKSGARPVEWAGYFSCALAAFLQAASAEFARAQASAESASGSWAAALNRVLPLEGVNAPAAALAAGLLLGLTAVVLRGKVDYDSLTATVVPMAYPGFLFSLMFSLQDFAPAALATAALMLSFFLASVNDVFALFSGMAFGRHRLSPEISPKKTIEGSVGGLIASVAFAALIAVVVDRLQGSMPFALPCGFGAAGAEKVSFPPMAFAALGLVAGVFSQAGDLTASLVKRRFGVKDYGPIFPGHGGMMDRFDGILFCAAAVWMFFHLFRF